MITFRKLGRLGRLGNQLFQYAGTYLYAKKNGFDMAMPHWQGTELFNVPAWSRVEHLRALTLPTFQLHDLQSWNRIGRIKYMLGIWKNLPETHALEELYTQPRDNINLYGYLQDEMSIRLLCEHRTELQKLFSFTDALQSKLTAHTASHTPWLGLHIRKGDLTWRNLSVPVETYKKQLAALNSSLPIYIASDDPNMRKEFSEFNIVSIPMPEGVSPVIFDFWMLMHARVVIGGGSTFSWWAAFLNREAEYYSPALTHLWPKGTIPPFEHISFNV